VPASHIKETTADSPVALCFNDNSKVTWCGVYAKASALLVSLFHHVFIAQERERAITWLPAVPLAGLFWWNKFTKLGYINLANR